MRCIKLYFVSKLRCYRKVFISGFSILIFFFLLTSFASFRISSCSMEPSILSGENVIVLKWALGGRLYNPFSSHEIKRKEIYRFPSLGRLRHNDIIVFNHPIIGKNKNKHIGLNIGKYYVKRVIALPGDTFQIKRAIFKTSGVDGWVGNVASQMYLNKINSSAINSRMLKAFNGTIFDIPPIVIPKRGTVITMNCKNFNIYKSVIQWENDTQRFWSNKGKVFIGHKEIKRYEFKENYYFVAGDNLIQSKDSRYWGLLPEKFIVGKAYMICYSQNNYTKEIRWERFFKLL